MTGTNTNVVLAGNSVDMEGVARDADGTWDRGALQMSGSVSTYTLIVTNGGNGTVTGTGGTANINCGSICTETENSGTAVTLTATANSGYTFAGWSGACSGTGTCLAPFTAPASVVATFATDKAPGQMTCPSTPVTYTGGSVRLVYVQLGSADYLQGCDRSGLDSGGQRWAGVDAQHHNRNREYHLGYRAGNDELHRGDGPPAAVISFTTEPIPVHLTGCQFTLTSTTTSPVTVTTSTDMPSSVFYGDAVTISGCTTDNPNSPRLTYAFASTGLKSTLLSEKVTFRATETVGSRSARPAAGATLQLSGPRPPPR